MALAVSVAGAGLMLGAPRAAAAQPAHSVQPAHKVLHHAVHHRQVRPHAHYAAARQDNDNIADQLNQQELDRLHGVTQSAARFAPAAARSAAPHRLTTAELNGRELQRIRGGISEAAAPAIQTAVAETPAVQLTPHRLTTAELNGRELQRIQGGVSVTAADAVGDAPVTQAAAEAAPIVLAPPAAVADTTPAAVAGSAGVDNGAAAAARLQAGKMETAQSMAAAPGGPVQPAGGSGCGDPPYMLEVRQKNRPSKWYQVRDARCGGVSLYNDGNKQWEPSDGRMPEEVFGVLQQAERDNINGRLVELKTVITPQGSYSYKQPTERAGRAYVSSSLAAIKSGTYHTDAKAAPAARPAAVLAPGANIEQGAAREVWPAVRLASYVAPVREAAPRAATADGKCPRDLMFQVRDEKSWYQYEPGCDGRPPRIMKYDGNDLQAAERFRGYEALLAPDIERARSRSGAVQVAAGKADILTPRGAELVSDAWGRTLYGMQSATARAPSDRLVGLVREKLGEMGLSAEEALRHIDDPRYAAYNTPQIRGVLETIRASDGAGANPARHAHLGDGQARSALVREKLREKGFSAEEVLGQIDDPRYAQYNTPQIRSVLENIATGEKAAANPVRQALGGDRARKTLTRMAASNTRLREMALRLA